MYSSARASSPFVLSGQLHLNLMPSVTYPPRAEDARWLAHDILSDGVRLLLCSGDDRSIDRDSLSPSGLLRSIHTYVRTLLVQRVVVRLWSRRRWRRGIDMVGFRCVAWRGVALHAVASCPLPFWPPCQRAANRAFVEGRNRRVLGFWGHGIIGNCEALPSPSPPLLFLLSHYPLFIIPYPLSPIPSPITPAPPAPPALPALPARPPSPSSSSLLSRLYPAL